MFVLVAGRPGSQRPPCVQKSDLPPATEILSMTAEITAGVIGGIGGVWLGRQDVKSPRARGVPGAEPPSGGK